LKPEAIRSYASLVSFIVTTQTNILWSTHHYQFSPSA